MSAPLRTCPNCSASLPELAAFCPVCGTATPPETPPTDKGLGAEHRQATDPPVLEQRLRAALADRYRIQRELGRGGNATVYLAHDLKHNRPVAVKVLSPALALTVRVGRFLREIEIAAKLSHPHILPVHDSGEAQGLLYYVMPYVEGESLRHRLWREGQLPLEGALLIAREVADALSYAHNRDVVHRDVKPENVLLQAGHAVVADFGIARALTPASGRTLTEEGLAVGTPAYMSPEQASGQQYVDMRSDIYSLGCVLYEMLAGHPPFTGASAQEFLARHCLDPIPSLRAARPDVPEAVERAVSKALAKEPADRWGSAAELAEVLAAAPSSQPPGSVPRRRGRRFTSLAVVTTLGVCLAAILLFRVAGRRAPFAPTYTQLTFTGDVTQADLSSDGKLFAFVSRQAGGDRLIVQEVTGGSTLAVASDSAIWDPMWSPEGSEILFLCTPCSGPQLVPRLGGAPRAIGPQFWHARFTNRAAAGDSRIVAWDIGKRIWWVDRRTGDTAAVALGGSWQILWDVDASPRGNLLAFVTSSEASGGQRALWTMGADGSRQQEVLRDTVQIGSPRWSPGGNAIYYLRGGDLWKIRVAGRGGKREGAPTAVLTGMEARGAFTLAADGRRLVFTRGRVHSNLWVATPNSSQGVATTVRLTTGTSEKVWASVSPDRRQVAFVQHGSTDNIFTMPLAGGPQRQITFTDVGRIYSIAWSPDGRRIAFIATRGGQTNIWVVESRGGTARLLTRRAYERGYFSGFGWAPGRQIVYALLQSPRTLDLLDPETGETRVLAQADTGAWIVQPRYSPDGQRIAVRSLTGIETTGLAVISVLDGSKVVVPAGDYDVLLGWSGDGRGVFTYDAGGGDITLVSIPSGEPRLVVTLPAGLIPVSMTPDGRRIVAARTDYSQSDAWMVENFDPEMR